jgi:hypothetical protein
MFPTASHPLQVRQVAAHCVTVYSLRENSFRATEVNEWMRDRTSVSAVGEADTKKKIGRFSLKRALFEITPFFLQNRFTSLNGIERTIQTDNIATTSSFNFLHSY